MCSLQTMLDTYKTNKVVKQIQFQGNTFEYDVLGEENVKTLIFLTGGSGISIPLFKYMLYFSKDYKVITLDYPAFKTMDALTDLIIRMIQIEKKESVSIVGQSMGGMVGQVLIYKEPALINKAILCHTTTTSAQLRESNLKDIDNKERDIRIISKFPQFLLRLATKSRMQQTIKENNLTNFTFWNKLFLQNIIKRSKNELISPLYLIIDFIKNYDFTEQDFLDMSNNTLIIDSKGDKSFTDKEKKAVEELFPKAKRIHFEDKPHLGLIEYFETYRDIIQSFLS